ncbi:MAG: hypothetical protein IT464_02155 [Planctomycetes bacterium]|nr:hypothetical protein [Planctomycetota bacterium]
MKTLAPLLLLLLFAAPLSARSPEEAEMLYHDVGDQMFCICGGCRDALLECSMNNCSAKVMQREFLRELCADEKLDAAGIKAGMVKRFGPKVLQVPEESSLFPILGVAVLLLSAAFGFGFWALTRKGVAQQSAPDTPTDEMDSRIELDLKELE